jgi:hypothetical protein
VSNTGAPFSSELGKQAMIFEFRAQKSVEPGGVAK